MSWRAGKTVFKGGDVKVAAASGKLKNLALQVAN